MLNVSAVHYARPLEMLAIDYHAAGMVAEEVFPVVPVVHWNDKYLVWDRDTAFTLPDDTVADGTAAKSLSTTFSYQTYVAMKHAYRFIITDAMVRNADSEIRLQVKHLRMTQDKILLNQEKRIAALMSNPANYAPGNTLALSGTNQWNNASFAGSIEAYFDGATEAIRQQTGGMQATHTVIPKPVAKVMKRDALIRDLIKYTHADLLVDGDLPPMVWGLKVIIPAATYNVSNEGVPGSMVDVWGKNVYVLYRPDNPGDGVLAYGYIFRVGGVQVRQWRQEDIDSTVYEVAYIQDERIVSPYAGYLLQNVIA